MGWLDTLSDDDLFAIREVELFDLEENGELVSPLIEEIEIILFERG